jgi:hypothetical protein
MTFPFMHRSHAGQKPARWQWVHVALGLFLLAGIAVGCGGGSGNGGGGGENAGQSAAEDSAATQPLQACDLLTTADVEAILGGTVDEPRQTSRDDEERQFWMSQCDYYAPQQERGAGLMIQSSANADPIKALEAHMANLKNSLGDAYEAQTVDGVGGAAVWDGSVKQLTVFDGAHMLIVTVTGAGQEEGIALETAKALAEKALAKLP